MGTHSVARLASRFLRSTHRISGRTLSGPQSARRRRRFELLELRQLMAVDVAASKFSPALMGSVLAELSDSNAVGFGYSINYKGDANAAADGGGQARTAFDVPARAFTENIELEVSSVSKPITATAILHFLQSMPGGLDAALKTRLIDYLPSDWTPGMNTQFITLRHLLTHRSGLIETGNTINVDFSNYGNNTFANLRSLLQAGVTAPNIAADTVYDGPRWSYSYNNANFTLLARVVLPKLINPLTNLTAAAYPALRDSVSGNIYKSYVQNEIFAPMGIVGADMTTNGANPAKGYNLGVNAAGASQTDLTNLGGAFGWKLTAVQLGTFLDHLQRNNAILSNSTRKVRDQQELGWFNSNDPFGDYYGHNGATTVGAGKFRSFIQALPGGIEAAYLMNSDDNNLPGGSITAIVKKAYVNGWTDLQVDGTPNADVFSLTTVTDSGKPAIRVTLNGVEQFTRWVEGLESITLNGSLGNDTFTVQDWNPSISLIINGQGDDDTVTAASSERNIEVVNGMVFDGGSGTDTLLVRDDQNPYSMPALSQTLAVSDTAIARHKGLNIVNVGLIPIPVTVNYANVENLTLNAGDQGDIVNLSRATSGETKIFTGAGNDTVRAAITTGNIESINGVELDGESGTDSVQVYDQNKSIGDDFRGQYDVRATSVSRYVTGGLIFNPNPPVYTVNFAAFENLELTTTDGADRVRVHDVPTGVTVVNGGAGADVLTTTPTEQNLELVRDLTFNGDAGVDEIVLNDQRNPYPRGVDTDEYSVTAGKVSRQMLLRGFTLNAQVSFAAVENLKLFTGQQSDTLEVASVPSGVTTLDLGDGSDVVRASSTLQKMEVVDDLTVIGGPGNDSLEILDANNPYELGKRSGEYTITPTSIVRATQHLILPQISVPVEIEFAGVENITLEAGNQSDLFQVSGSNGPATLTIHGNQGADTFQIDSPAFGSITIHGNAPIAQPGDELLVNLQKLYTTSPIPGIYPAGAGGVMLGSTTILYDGIESQTILQKPANIPGDYDGDGDVDSADLLEFMGNWTGALPPGTGGKDLASGDFDGDADCDSADLLAFLSAWTGANAERLAESLLATDGVFA